MRSFHEATFLQSLISKFLVIKTSQIVVMPPSCPLYSPFPFLLFGGVGLDKQCIRHNQESTLDSEALIMAARPPLRNKTKKLETKCLRRFPFLVFVFVGFVLPMLAPRARPC